VRRRPRSRILRATLGALAVLAYLVAWYLGREWYLEGHPGAAFTSITGRELPDGVRVDAYAKVRAGVFRRTHFWTFSGEPEAIRKFGEALGLARSDEDARLVFSNPRELSSLPQFSELQGRQYIVLRDGTEALYVHY